MSKTLRTVQRVIQILFLVLFISLLVAGKVQLWMIIFLIGLVSAFLLGRVYCGWICPINTSMKLVTFIKKKLKIKSFSTPIIMKKTAVRYTMLIAFIITFVFVMITGKKLPVLATLFLAGFLLTIFYTEELWHRYLCPYGTLLSFLGSKARHFLVINQGNCINCGICSKVCPSVAISSKPVYKIHGKDCLGCFDCVIKCPKGTIIYK